MILQHNNELRYVAELKKVLWDAPKSELLILTRDWTISEEVSGSAVSFECVQQEGWRARNILGKVAFGDNCEEIISNLGAESEYVEILKVCSGLQLALGIAGSGLREYYGDSRDENGREDPSFTVRNYWKGLKIGRLDHLEGENIYYHRNGLKYAVEASFKSCEVWWRSGGPNYEMTCLFRSLNILEKQQFLPVSTLKL